jgi:hypothetical protein
MKTQPTGYWTFFCNPARWQIDKFLERNIEHDDCTIADQQASWFKPGQLGLVSEWRAIRGALVHAAAAGEQQTASMRRFRDVVRTAVLEELRRASATAQNP